MTHTHGVVRATLALTMAVLVAACGSATATPAASGPSASAGGAQSAAAPAESLNPTLAPVPSYAVASPATESGLEDLSGLLPPDFETGDVPAYAAPAPAVVSAARAGAARPLASGSAGPGGATISVAKPGDPLDGLTITIPPGTYATTVQFSVSSKPLDGSAIASGYTAASAVVSIENGGAVATGDPVLVSIPATIPAEAEVTGLYLHPDGHLDPLPVVARDAKSATVAASHFSDIVLALVNWAVIPDTVDSGFRPGVDDWQFTNYGSYVAPGGHCEGQSVTAIWYYDTQRLAGASPLHGLYDNNGADPSTPGFWMDDSDGYRFASAVQASPIAIPKAYTGFRDLGQSWSAYTYSMFKAAIALTGHPQLLAMTDAQGGHGHAMVVYRVSRERMYVADPNYPGRLRTIRWDPATSTLGPYYSGDNAGAIAAGGGVAYTRFAFIPAEASAGDGFVAGEWAKLEDNKAGDDVFPAAPLEYFTGAKDDLGSEVWAAVTPTLTTSERTLRVRAVGSPNDIWLRGFLGTKLQGSAAGEVKITLKDGPNDVGLSEFKARNGAWAYLDFTRSTVTYEPIDINGTWLGEITFTDITVSDSAKAKAEDEGCDLALLEALRGRPLPMTLELTADKQGDGSGTLIVDTRSLQPDTPDQSEPEAQSLTLVYRDGKITFDLSAACGSAGACKMVGVPAAGATADPDDDVIEGTLAIVGDGYAARATYTVTRQP